MCLSTFYLLEMSQQYEETEHVIIFFRDLCRREEGGLALLSLLCEAVSVFCCKLGLARYCDPVSVS